MPPSTGYTEDALVEQPAIALFGDLGWETVNCYHELLGAGGTLGRETRSDVVLVGRLRSALERLNPGIESDAIRLAIEELTRDRGAMSAARGNREIYQLLKNGVKVTVGSADEEGQTVETVTVVDWRNPANNDFFLVSQLWVTGEMYTRRTDLVGFINGLPLVFVELKASHKALKAAFDNNLNDYKAAIPQLFWFNQIIVLSNGSESRIGSVTASWEHFAEWKKISSEGERGIVSLETIIRGTCEPARLLDLVENFILFDEGFGELVKLVGKNHQVLGVNAALEALAHVGENRGKLGVFWHTQGSGKSVSMIFFAQKILRTIPGNWTFVVVTDRQELDDQIYKNFANVGAVTEVEAQAQSSEDLRRLLREDHRYVFTLVQKFRTEAGAQHPVLSDRSDVIVMTDEAHRSQYDTFALNMRTALPNGAFIGFTGTPLMAGEERTKEVFGDYVSVYNFKQSVDDGATVPLYYENRIPELQLTNVDLNDDMAALLDEALLDEAQERKLEQEFGREYHLVTREDRLETIAEDLVAHFMGRGHRGKAMVVCIDKATAVRMYDKVRAHWDRYLARLRSSLETAASEEREDLEATIAYMARVDMAVVVSQSQNEIPEMAAKGLDIVPHRRRMVREDLAAQFKNADDPLALVFVCAMWMTGFDVPSCSTIYLDKPMRNHTLMQTIARANRVARDKVNGLIIDYVGVFRNLQQALAIYSPSPGGDEPVQDKTELVSWLKQAIAEVIAFCTERGVDIVAIEAAGGFERVKLLDDAVEAIIVDDDSKRAYLLHASKVARLYRAILPDPAAAALAPTCIPLIILAEKIRALVPPPDISAIMADVEELLNESIAAEGYVIRAPVGTTVADADAPHMVDLSRIDFDALKAKFATARKRTEAEKLRAVVSRKLTSLVRLNKGRLDYLDKFQRMIDDYNSGSLNVEQFFDQLIAFAQGLTAEEQRGVAEGLSEEELALFDLLTKPEPTLTETEQRQVKTVARELLEALKREKLVLDWRKRQATRAAVRVAIEEALDRLPETYTTELFQTKCDLAYQHVYDSYFGEGSSVYTAA